MVQKNPKQLQDQSRWVLAIGTGLHSVVSSGGVFWGTDRMKLGCQQTQ